MRELWGKILQTGGVKIYSVILGMISITITARILGPSGRGELVAITTWVTTFSTFAYFSLGQIAVHQSAKTEGKGWLPDAYHTLVSFTALASVAGWVVALLTYFSPMGSIFGDITPLWLLMGFLLLPFYIWEHYSSSLLMALERLDIYNRFQLLGSTFGFMLTLFLLVVIGLGVEGVLTSYIVSQCLIAAGGLALLHRAAGGWSPPRWSVVKGYLGSGLKLHLNAIGTFFISGSDILMLNYYRGSEETAFYQLGVQLMGMMMLVPQAAQMVIYGKVSALGPDKAWRTHRKILLQVTGLVAVGALVAGLTAPWWIVLLVGEAFVPSVALFQWLLLASIGMTFSVVMAPQWIGRGFFSVVSVMTMAFGGINLLLNWFWIPKYGMYGALYATLITYTISVFINGGMAVYCQKKTKS